MKNYKIIKKLGHNQNFPRPQKRSSRNIESYSGNTGLLAVYLFSITVFAIASYKLLSNGSEYKLLSNGSELNPLFEAIEIRLLETSPEAPEATDSLLVLQNFFNFVICTGVGGSLFYYTITQKMSKQSLISSAVISWVTIYLFLYVLPSFIFPGV